MIWKIALIVFVCTTCLDFFTYKVRGQWPRLDLAISIGEFGALAVAVSALIWSC